MYTSAGLRKAACVTGIAFVEAESVTNSFDTVTTINSITYSDPVQGSSGGDYHAQGESMSLAMLFRHWESSMILSEFIKCALYTSLLTFW